MTIMEEQRTKLDSHGVAYTAAAYIMWGFLPLYWKLLESVPSGEILAYRILWSFIFMILLLAFSRSFQKVKEQWKVMTKGQIIALAGASILISINWFVYIWAVNANLVVEASLGYYVNPLVSVLLGVIFLKEKLNFWQLIAVLLAAVGVGILTFQYGTFPWIALSLALSFGFYGLVKKKLTLEPKVGLTLETLFVTPVALFYVLFLFANGHGILMDVSLLTFILLAGGGIVTAVPLLYFAKGAQRIPLSMVGFLQYIAPTIMLFVGTVVFHEPFSSSQLLTFMLIWIGSIIFSLSKTKFMLSHQPRFKKESSLH